MREPRDAADISSTSSLMVDPLFDAADPVRSQLPFLTIARKILWIITCECWAAIVAAQSMAVSCSAVSIGTEAAGRQAHAFASSSARCCSDEQVLPLPPAAIR
jgi:hypothetical protein